MALSGTKYEMAQLGQFGSIFCDTAGDVTPPADFIICAIFFLADTNITKLTAENTTDGKRMFPSTAYSAHEDANGIEGSGGDTIAAGQEFPKGSTIYGRWTELAITADAAAGVIAYLAPKH